MLIKICGVRTIDEGLAAARAGADLVGFVTVSKSPRFVRPEDVGDLAADIKQACYAAEIEPPHFVGLVADPAERLLAEIAPAVSHFQFHGHESPSRVRELGDEFGMETIKAAPVSSPADLAGVDELADAADMLLFDAKPPPGADREGGHGATFDWSIIEGYASETPFLLAGGLGPDNVAGAVAGLRANAAFAGVDVSSGVERAPGEKDEGLIDAFVKAARAADKG